MKFAEIIEQLESCEYECEAGPLELNTAFIRLKAMTATWKVLQALYDAVDDYIYSSGDNAYPDDHHNLEFLANLRAAFLAVADTLEAENQAPAPHAGRERSATMYYIKRWDDGEIVYEFEKLPIARRYARGMGHTGEDHPMLTGYPPIAHVVNEKGECVYNPRFSKQIGAAGARLIAANDDHLRA